MRSGRSLAETRTARRARGERYSRAFLGDENDSCHISVSPSLLHSVHFYIGLPATLDVGQTAHHATEGYQEVGRLSKTEQTVLAEKTSPILRGSRILH
jgi:hypothetical protein